MSTVAACRPARHEDTPAPATVSFSQARFAHAQLETWLRSAAARQLPAQAVEEETARQGREILRLLLEAHFRERGTGALGPALQVPPQPVTAEPAPAPDGVAPAPAESVRLARQRLHARTLKTTFGPVTIQRTAYGAPGQASIHPLDAQAELPARSFSYPLQERLVRAAVQGPYDEALANVAAATGVGVAKRSAEQLAQAAAGDVAAFYEHQAAPDPATTGALVVGGVDGKGVPMVKPEKTLRAPRLGKGQKRQKKRMATVATVRTQEPRVRTAEEVVASLFDDQPAPPLLRVRREEHQRVWASLRRSKQEVIADLAAAMRRCNPEGAKKYVAVCDGERAFQIRLETHLAGVLGVVVLVLDFMHVLEKLWKAAYCFHAEGSTAAQAWVRQRALQLLRGQVHEVIAELRAAATAKRPRSGKRKTLEKVASYFERNAERMRYDAYLREGLPIASGAVEGACRHLVKDRLERAGMRWSLDGAEAMLQLRAVYLSGDLDDYLTYHRCQEQQRLHPAGAWTVVGE
jgi:hypothetical protein